MTIHLYLSLIPEALIASMLSPEDFGSYYAVGTARKQHGQAMFLELDRDFRHEAFRIDDGYARCVPHEDGTPKKSVYISEYRVLERVPLNVVKKLYLVTAYGEVLGLDRDMEIPESDERLHLYQEIAPVTPLVASTLDPVGLYDFIVRDRTSMIDLPAIAFVELRLDELARDPEHGAIRDLPYDSIPHLRECLMELRTKSVHTKMVNRVHGPVFAYRTIKNGVFIGNRQELAYFPLPSLDELRSTHYRWWRSANL